MIPSFRIDPSTDDRVAVMDGFKGRIGKHETWAPLTHFGWLGPEAISATLTAKSAEELALTPSLCPCDVELTDPRGRTALLADAFMELGPDREPPVITVESPSAGQLYCPGATVHAWIIASETPPSHITSLTWELKGSSPEREVRGRCPLEPGTSHVECRFDVIIDPEFLPDTRTIFKVTSVDDVGNAASRENPVVLGQRPAVFKVSPATGPTAGGTNVIIQGSNFEADSRAYFDNTPLYPNGGIVSKDRTNITGYTPAHPEGDVTLTVISRLGRVSMQQAFYYREENSGGTP